MIPWRRFSRALGPTLAARYSRGPSAPGQIPARLPGVNLGSRYIGGARTNCTMFTAWVCGVAFGGTWSQRDWSDWQVIQDSRARGCGPGVGERLGIGRRMAPDVAARRRGVYLVQTFSSYPAGHSMLVLDVHPVTGRLLTLEANTAGTGLDGVGFMGCGPLRHDGPRGWYMRTLQTWKSRVLERESYVAQLDVDPREVRAWVEALGSVDWAPVRERFGG